MTNKFTCCFDKAKLVLYSPCKHTRLDVGIGKAHLNTILTTLNIPPMSRSTIKKREKEVGLAVENVAKKAVQIL